MPTQVTFRVGTKAQYDALQTKDEGCLYFVTDKNMIYRGNVNVTSRYLISAVPAASNPENYDSVRLTDQQTGNVYDIPLLDSLATVLENGLRYHPATIQDPSDLLDAIGAESGVTGSGTVKAGTVFRVERPGGGQQYNPGQFAKADYLLPNNHDLIIALYDIKEGRVNIPNRQGIAGYEAQNWTSNHQAFAVIPVDLVDLVTASTTLDNNKVILGAGGKIVKAMDFGTAGQVLRMNNNANGVEWVTPETVQNVVYWEDIA